MPPFAAGAHWGGSYKDALGNFSAFARALGQGLGFGGTVVFRTTVMGHPCCQRFAGPLARALDRDKMWYNWRSFDASRWADL